MTSLVIVHFINKLIPFEPLSFEYLGKKSVVMTNVKLRYDIVLLICYLK